MARRKYHSLPKRIAGVKIPKRLRRFADTEFGGSLLANVMFGGFASAAANPKIREAGRQLRQNVMSAAAEAISAMKDTSINPARPNRRADGEDLAH